MALCWDRTQDTLQATCPPCPGMDGCHRHFAPWPGRHPSGTVLEWLGGPPPQPPDSSHGTKGCWHILERWKHNSTHQSQSPQQPPRAEHADASVMPSGSGFVTVVLSWQSLAATPEPEPGAATSQPCSTSGLSLCTAPASSHRSPRPPPALLGLPCQLALHTVPLCRDPACHQALCCEDRAVPASASCPGWGLVGGNPQLLSSWISASLPQGAGTSQLH